MKNLSTLSTCVVLFCFGLWPIAFLLVYAVSYKELIKERQRLDERPIEYPTFEQKQLMAIIAALEAGQMEKADLLTRRFQQEW
jgi:hypothetical protein